MICKIIVFRPHPNAGEARRKDSKRIIFWDFVKDNKGLISFIFVKWMHQKILEHFHWTN